MVKLTEGVGLNRYSIVVPAYNAEATLRETLSAISSQVYSHWECVVVDDGSVDDTLDIAESYARDDRRFRTVPQENRGISGAYNTGVAGSCGDFVVICSADDLLLPNHLAVMDRLIESHPGHGIYSSNGEYLDHSTGMRTVVYTAAEWQQQRSLAFADVLKACFFSVGATYRRELFDMLGGYRGIIGEDYDFWLRAMAAGVTHLYTPDRLAVHRVSSFQQSANVRRVLEADIATLHNLLGMDLVTDEQRPLVESAIAGRVHDLTVGPAERFVDQVLEQQSEAFRARVESIVGARRADATLRLLHKVTWVTRPLRRRWARRRQNPR